MHRIRSRYHALSFRNRLMLLLVAVSLVQASVAAYTFFALQSKPAEQRVQAQLNASLRGAAPVLDDEMGRSADHLELLLAHPDLLPAVESADWSAVEAVLSDETIGADAAAAAADDVASDDAAAGDDAAADDVASDDAAAGDDAAAADVTPPGVYVTDSRGEIVAGTRPDGVLVDQAGVTSAELQRGAELLATVHVPVAIDSALLEDRISQYVEPGVKIFAANDQQVVGAGAASQAPDAALREGLHEVSLGGTEQLAFVQPFLDGSVVIGAAVPIEQVAKEAREGRGKLWGFITLLTVLTIGVAWIITRAVGDALRRFSQIARDLADGQLHRRIPVVGEDEVAVLSTSFNDMAEHLEARIQSLIEARASMRRQVELFGEALANATEMEEMLQVVCSLAMESTPATHARFWTIGEDGHYEHAACVGLRPGDTEPCALEKAVPVRNMPVQGEGSPHWLVVPARLQGQQIVGLLTLVSTGEAFEPDDVKISERIAVQAAVALENARMHEKLKMQATRDGLTGLPNHRSLQDELARRVEEAASTGMPLGIALLDIDNFKRVNDTYGHPVGDEAIKALGKTLAHGLGVMGTVGRYGGEEFVIIMPGCDADAACRIADRLRHDITTIEVPLPDGGVLKITASFGVTDVDQQRELVTGAELLHQADIGLYNAKRTGKNRIYLAGPDTQLIEMSGVERAKLEARERGDAAAEQAAAAQLQADGPAPVSDPFDLAA